jgi:glutamine amidotransferase|tara:strand:- start:4711 stop:5346 length:636 start_codon:yes stop_codon:yes gene_type:complete
MSADIVIIDYGIGNIKSICSALSHFNINISISNDEDEILSAKGIILPGVGAFKSGMKNLLELNLDLILKKYFETNKPILGICLGMQLLFESSEEFGFCEGLGLIEGKVQKLKNEKKLPHIAWSEIKKTNSDNTILDGINNNSDFYFVHSFVSYPKNTSEMIASSNYYNQEFCSVVKKGNIYGCQFHPEKSGSKGLKLLENFIKLTNKPSHR